MSDSCVECKHSRVIPADDELTGAVLKCLRYPPKLFVIQDEDGYELIQTVPDASWVCGEFTSEPEVVKRGSSKGQTTPVVLNLLHEPE